MQTIRILSFSLIAPMMLMSFNSLPSQQVKYQVDKTVILPIAKATWVKDTHDFGEIPKGIPVSVEFSFTNTGDAALIIKDVATTCGCTASDYTQEPIMPGKSSTIKVTYNAANPGAFSKSITVNSIDREKAKVLSIKSIGIFDH